MPKITIITKAKAVGEGFTRSILNIRTSIMKHREEEYCKKCPLSHRDGIYTGTCSSKDGGCGCQVAAKTSQNHEPCPKGFWAHDYFKPDKFAEYINKNPINQQP